MEDTRAFETPSNNWRTERREYLRPHRRFRNEAHSNEQRRRNAFYLPKRQPTYIHDFGYAGEEERDTRRMTNIAEENVSPPLSQQDYIPRRIHRNVHHQGFQFQIPPLYKRFLAEVLDFMFILMTKVVFVVVMMIFNKPTDQDFLSTITNFGYEKDISILLLIKISHQIVGFIYEMICLSGHKNMKYGCASPGKILMGLVVVSCTKIKYINPHDKSKVLVYPVTDLGYYVSAKRAFMKNVVIPLHWIFLALFIVNEHNRTGYDLLSNTVVVEFDRNPPRRIF